MQARTTKAKAVPGVAAGRLSHQTAKKISTLLPPHFSEQNISEIPPNEIMNLFVKTFIKSTNGIPDFVDTYIEATQSTISIYSIFTLNNYFEKDFDPERHLYYGCGFMNYIIHFLGDIINTKSFTNSEAYINGLKEFIGLEEEPIYMIVEFYAAYTKILQKLSLISETSGQDLAAFLERFLNFLYSCNEYLLNPKTNKI